MNQPKYAIHWFRRDLRIAGNAALWSMIKKYQGAVIGIFIIDPAFLSREDFSAIRFDFFLQSIVDLKKALQEIGIELLVLEEGPVKSWQKLLENDLFYKPEVISFNRDYEPFARKRDEHFKKQMKDYQIDIFESRDHLLIEPHELLKNDGSYYKVFTPFSKLWKTILWKETVQDRIKNATWEGTKNKRYGTLLAKIVSKKAYSLSDKILNKYCELASKQHDIQLPRAGHKESIKALKIFSKKISTYENDRNIPIKEGTSKLSLYLKNGTLTSGQIIKHLNLLNYKKNPSLEKYLNEIIWREFYYHVLYHCPGVEKNTFQEKYNNLAWQKNSRFLNAWKEGKTGFPIVDAGMRELNTTGWMHNRVRMIVASFLTKDLLIDYREGEKYFMQKLIDGDLAANNGGWQWAASTGCDAQPYFRIFNPWTQGLKFDPQCLYIKKFIPELKNDDPRVIHDPEGKRSKPYPVPIVSHEVQRVLALKIYNQR